MTGKRNVILSAAKDLQLPRVQSVVNVVAVVFPALAELDRSVTIRRIRADPRSRS